METRQYVEYNRVREVLTFAEVLDHYEIDFPQGKTQIKIKCPFHPERTPSCSINVERGIFQCFGCGAKGNVLEFVVLMEKGDPEDKADLHAGALKAIEIMGRSVEEFAPRASKSAKRSKSRSDGRTAQSRPSGRTRTKNTSKATPGEDNEANLARSNKPLDLELDLDPNHPFLEERGIDLATCEEFEVGYCASGMHNGRIAARIDNENGIKLAYIGRWATEPVPEGVPRYKLPKNFHKSLVLYNMHRARAFGKRHLVIVESLWSTMRLHNAEIPTVALLGHSMSPEQAELVKACGFRFVTLLLDGDEPGRDAVPPILDVLTRHVYVRNLVLPDGEKPDTMPEHRLNSLR